MAQRSLLGLTVEINGSTTGLDKALKDVNGTIEHFTKYIASHPEWEFAGMYADEGISGTQMKKRDEFNRMIRDCEARKIEMIMTKSIARWARNTVDSLMMIRKLKALGVGVLFEKESIYTLDAKGEGRRGD